MSQIQLYEQMSRSADIAVRIAAEAFFVELDFSEQSVQRLETILDRMHKDLPRGLLARMTGRVPTKRRIWEWALLWGAYLGEVIRRQLGGQWTDQAGAYPETITLRIGALDIYPPAKVYKRLTNGPEDNVWHYYRVIEDRLLSKNQQQEK